MNTFRLLLRYGARLTYDELIRYENCSELHIEVYKKAKMLLALCTPGSVPRGSNRSVLRVLPTDVLRTLSAFLYEKPLTE